jgi:phosphoglycerol transferase MdoB-like AlkP superfamily enzyme
MPIEQITEIFKWMTIINLVIFFLSLIATILLKDQIFRIQSTVYGLTEERISEITYGLFGIYKIAITVLNFVPYITLLIIQ